jgi:hypothetical protein
MESLPTGNVVVAKVATPLLFKVPVPIVVLPFLKVTVPAGVAPVVAVTVAVKVTDAPDVDGFNDDLRVVVVGEGLTT